MQSTQATVASPQSLTSGHFVGWTGLPMFYHVKIRRRLMKERLLQLFICYVRFWDRVVYALKQRQLLDQVTHKVVLETPTGRIVMDL